jgi:hypothetical protein
MGEKSRTPLLELSVQEFSSLEENYPFSGKH